MQDIQNLIVRAGTPASLPEVVIRLNSLMNDPKSSAADIGHVIEQDPALCARLLKIVNSPYYGFPSRIDSISRAIAVIGIRDLRDLILATSTLNAFSSIKQTQFDMQRFWKHSLYCALISKLLAEKMGESHVEGFFVAGLLHDIGNLILFQAIPDAVNENIRIARKLNQSLYRVEKNHLGFTHADVGAVLLGQWGLPENLIEATACHHTPKLAKQYPADTSIVHIANFLANSMEKDSSITGMVQPLDPHCWEITGLNLEMLQGSLFQVSEQFHQMYEVLFPKNKAA